MTGRGRTANAQKALAKVQELKALAKMQELKARVQV